MNLPPFYIGQKVVYITGKSMPKNSIHTVTGIIQSSCGCWDISINGIPFDKQEKPSLSNSFVCSVCLKIINRGNPVDELKGWSVESFRPLQQTKFPLMTFYQIKEKETTEILINN